MLVLDVYFDYSCPWSYLAFVRARGAAMRFLLTRLYDWFNHPAGALVARKDPREYLAKLRFHQGLSGPGASGLDHGGGRGIPTTASSIFSPTGRVRGIRAPAAGA